MNKILPLKQRLFILIGSMVSLVTLIGWLIIFPTIRRIDSIDKDIYVIEKFIEEEYFRASEFKKSIPHLEDVDRTKHKFERAVIRQGDELSVITELEALAEEYKISQSLDVEFTEKSAKVRLPYFTFSFVNHGEFSDMVKHLRALEQLPYYIFIDTLSWESGQASRGRTADGALTLRYTGKIYMQPTKE